MIEIRWHGRGGQGVVTAANILGAAAMHAGKYSQSFPFFGAERRGAPVAAYTRIADQPVRLRSHIYAPHWVIVFDETLLELVNPLEGLRPGGGMIVNTRRNPEEIAFCDTVIAVDATTIAQEMLERPVANTAMLGAVAAAGLADLEPLLQAIGDAFPGAAGERNVRAAREAYRRVTSPREVQFG